jgi:3-phenylpropionate/trans-cinnamate dioxygenase ferredoxin subunit
MIPVAALADLPVGEGVRVAADVPIAVFRTREEDEGSVYAIDDTCTHQRASLSEGWVEDAVVECPLHSVCFDLRTGQPDGLFTRVPVRTHQVVVLDGFVYVCPSVELATATVSPSGGGTSGIEVA